MEERRYHLGTLVDVCVDVILIVYFIYTTN